MKIATVSEMRAMDRQAVEQYGISELILMENAGIAASTVLSNHVKIRHKTFLVFCGSGNNGGDGFVMARYIHQKGLRATVFLLTQRDRIKGDAGANLKLLDTMGVPVVATDISGIPELIENMKTGLLVPSGQTDKLAQAMIRMLTDAELRSRIIPNARKRINQHFDSKELIGDLARIYSSVMSNK